MEILSRVYAKAKAGQEQTMTVRQLAFGSGLEDRVRLLAEGRAAFARLAEAEQFGKIVLSV